MATKTKKTTTTRATKPPTKTATKSTAARARATRSKDEKSLLVDEPVKKSATTPATRPTIRFKRVHFLILAGGLLLIGLLFALRSLFVAATVNGQPISRLAIVSELESLQGKNVLESHILKAIIFQEAEKKGITVSDKEVDDEYKKSEAQAKQQGQELAQALAFRGFTPETYKEQIRIQKIAEKMFGEKATVSEKEIDDYIVQNQPPVAEGAEQPSVDTKEQREQAKQTLRQQKIYNEFQKWLDNTKKNAKINYFTNYN